MENKIYLDNAATTRVDETVLTAMWPYFGEEYGNASSLHFAGLNNRVVIDRSQAQIAKFLGCLKSEIYFTSGATESDNMAIFGVLEALRLLNKSAEVHIITTKMEHDAILEPCLQLEKRGVKVTYLMPDQDGQIRVDQLQAAIRPETVLVSMMYVNNEVGAILPIAEFGTLIAQLNLDRKNKIYFHTDATQALNFLECQVETLKVDLLSLSGHKIYGPKGIGAIYIKKGTPFQAMIFGGHQQADIRPGTYNVPGIVGLATAIELLNNRPSINQQNIQIKELRDYLVEKIMANVQGVFITGGLQKRSPNNLSLVIEGIDGEDVVLALSEQGIAVSTGSACSSGSLDPSHVLLAIGVKPELARGSVRISLSKYNTKNELDIFIEALLAIIPKLRQI